METNEQMVKQATVVNRYEVTAADLPLSCPMPGAPLWSGHPRVYLPLAETGTARCPYCGAEYVLVGGKAGHH